MEVAAVVTVEQYFADSVEHFDYEPTQVDRDRADDLLTRVGALEEEWVSEGGKALELNSGHRTRQKSLKLIAAGYSAVLGGKHETSNGVDLGDADDSFDDWISSFDVGDGAENPLLERFGLWREAPTSTSSRPGRSGWCHLQNVPPKSGRRTFFP